jgi:hypothetical protein
MRLARPSTTTWIAIAIFTFTWLIFTTSRVYQVTDSSYSMLVSQSLIEHHTFRLDNYAIPRLQPKNCEYYTCNGEIYQIELANDHLYYHLPPGSSILSVPYVALMKLLGMKVTNVDGTYSLKSEIKIEASHAALLMAILAVIFFYTALIRLPPLWSAIVAVGAALGSQAWSTASRAMWSDTWAIVLLGLVVWMLLANASGKRNLNPYLLASLLAWTYFIRPTYSVHILAVTVYVGIYYRHLLIPYALTGATWFAAFIFYSWHNFGKLLPSYYQPNRLKFDVFWTALAGNLISPARGLLVYVPATLFVGYLLVRFWKYVELKRLVFLSLAVIAVHLIVVSGYGHWWGGHSFGARFTTGLLPWLALLSILGLGALLKWRDEQIETKKQARWRVTLIGGGALLLLSMAINARGALSHATWFWNVRPRGVDEYPERLWDWREPQFLAGWVRPPIPADVVDASGRIDFSSAEGDKYAWFGWSFREEGFRWSEGNEAGLVFNLDPVADVAFTVKIFGFLPQGKIKEQRVYVSLNDHPIETLVLNDEKPREFRLVLPKNLLRQRNTMVFGLPDAASPLALGINEDSRQLGIGLCWIQLQRG